MSEVIGLQEPSQPSHIGLRTGLNIWLLYQDDAFEKHMAEQLSHSRQIHMEAIAMAKFDLDQLNQMRSPDLIFVEAANGWADIIQSLSKLSSKHQQHHTTLVVFGEEHDSQALKTALRLGASDYFSHHVLIAELAPLLRHCAEEKVGHNQLGELCLFINTKGGAGATTLALNTAIELAQYHHDDVLLLELDSQFGALNDYLNLSPKFSLLDVLENSGDLDNTALDGFVTKHKSGLHLLTFNHQHRQRNQTESQALGKLMPILRQRYPFVIVDLSRGLDAHAYPLLSAATHLYLVTQQQLAALNLASMMVNELHYEFGLARQQVEVVINRFDKQQPIGQKDIEHTLPNIAIHFVPNAFKTALESTHLGKSMAEVKKRNPVSKALQHLSQQIDPDLATDGSWFKRLFS
ncbi:hypothetical protein VST7929_01813 [Vibrio stylophorae]|uniref:AAA domain-containing protein n=1 Tax=Vibrio stylophorae TaxID=659351 RepID=A0ABM8ZUD9_9VIBR|nr:AAA family ATPase [Vibrio stylophorae]CAH0533936.1 hypothetical protein VST7929_01813 [Vibrio stylophorae]